VSELDARSSEKQRRDQPERRHAVGSEDDARVLLDPTSERQLAVRSRVPRLKALAGQTVGLLDISKPRGDVFLDRLEEILRGQGAEVVRFAKPTFTKPAPVDLRHAIATRCHAVIEALAD
jgi:hypothetical protein